MATVRIVITLKPGVLDAQGLAVREGLRALGYGGASDVKVGRYIEVTVPDDVPEERLQEMCERFLANPLIEQWRFDRGPDGPRTRTPAGRARGPRAEAGEVH